MAASFALILFLHTCRADVGILYEVWHTRAAQAMARQSPQLTTELVLESDGNLTLNDVFRVGPPADIFNVQPEPGFYCLYRARPGQAPPLPDCANVSRTAAAHAATLTAAGFDYVTVDITNWPNVDVGGATDVSVLRPTEVLFEEWAALRAAGTPTPSIAVWPCSPAGSTTWAYLLDTLYNNATFDGLVWRYEGKKAVFVPYTPTCFDAGTVALIEANGGRHDVVVIPMWALFGDGGGGPWLRGVWGFFSPCTDATGDFTTSVAASPPCNQFTTARNNTNGAQLMEATASGGYMLSQCALPFASPGHLRGLTMAKLFEKILALRPPQVFVSSFNEHIGGRQAPASRAKIAFNMGLPSDPQRDAVWVDSYAAEFSRDIEPSVEGGARVLAVAASCVALYKRNATCAQAAPGEACCTRADKEVFANAWSLRRVDGSDFLVTPLRAERDALVAGGAWAEQCSPIPNPTAFCVDGGEPDGRSGPFILYNAPHVDHPRGDGAPFPTAPLFRCYTGAHHFFSRDPACEGATTESIIGYVSLQRGWETLRALRRCLAAAGSAARLHALDLPCDVADPAAPGVLGFVR
jgi:hypothetical protein